MDPIENATLDPQFKFDVAAHPGGENITLCYACGTCTASCPIAAIDEAFNPRKIIRQVLLGQRKEVLSDPVLWRCIQCYACYSQCPQNVKFRDVMRALREMAVAEGYLPADTADKLDDAKRCAMHTYRDLVTKLLDDPAAYDTTRTAIEQALDTDPAGD
jgi:heterodisulfide reductase subunit C